MNLISDLIRNHHKYYYYIYYLSLILYLFIINACSTDTSVNSHSSQNESNFIITTIESYGDVGSHPCIAVEGQGIVHISYYDTDEKQVKYARGDGEYWDITIVETDVETYSCTWIYLDSSNNPHIVYPANGGIYYSIRNGSAWVREKVPNVFADGDLIPKLVLDSNDFPHICYYIDQLYYIKLVEEVWEKTNIDNSSTSDGSITLDSNNIPHISYFDHQNGDLKYAYLLNGIWTNEYVDFTGNVGSGSSIKLDYYDYPHIAYRDTTNCAIKYAFWNGDSWITDIVDQIHMGIGATSLALDGNIPHICYAMGNQLKYAKYNDTNWYLEVIKDDVDVCCYSLGLDINGKPHIVYYDGEKKDLIYAKWEN
jgi:hypothetical protein